MSFGAESIYVLVPRIWELISGKFRNAISLGIFKEKIKFWITDRCSYRLSKTYVWNVNFILQVSREIKHAICGVTLSSFSNVLLCICK